VDVNYVGRTVGSKRTFYLTTTFQVLKKVLVNPIQVDWMGDRWHEWSVRTDTSIGRNY